MAKRVLVNWKVSPKLKAWVEAHVELGEFPDPGACAEDAIRRFQEMHGGDETDELLDQARRSGKARPVTERDFERLRQDLRAFAAAYRRVTTI